MSDIITYNSVTIDKLMSNLELYKYNPSLMQRATLDYLSELTNGEVNIVDPTNPFVFLLEASAINTSLAISESVVNLRKQYPSLAQTEEDLYLHMSDIDFVNRFATPATTQFTIVIQVNNLLSKLHYDVNEKVHKATMPRDSEFSVDGIVFTLQYPIDIRKFDNGVLQISYNTEIASPLQTLTSNIIDYTIRTDNDSVDWIFFNIDVSQFNISTTYFNIQLSSVFSQTIICTDRYYYCRVYYKNSPTDNTWLELKTTHTDQVFDPFKPTAVIKTYTGFVNITIPTIYLTSGLVIGDIRVDLYTTRGSLTVNLANYKLSSFSTNLKAIDEIRDISDFTNVMSDTNFYTFSNKFVSGGTNGIDFNTLRERVIFNSIGDRQLPITNNQLQAKVNNTGFDLIKNVDVVTNRIFLASRKLSKPINNKLITAAGIGISTVILNIETIKNSRFVSFNNSRLTILSNTLMINNNGMIRLLSDIEVTNLYALSKQSLIDTINNNNYIYTPFYYVLDSTRSEFSIKAYSLDYPTASNLSFVSQNQSLQLPVNTGSYTVVKTPNGYRLTIITKSGNFYKLLADSQVSAQLSYKPSGETSLVYINGSLSGTTNLNERIYTFDLITNYDINSKDQISILNSRLVLNDTLTTPIDLTTTFNIVYITNSITTGYTPDITNNYVNRALIGDNFVGITHESVILNLGTPLDNLWSRSRSFASGLNYATYPDDIPLVYHEDVYSIDPITNSIFSIENNEVVYNILHHKGDPVLDDHGNPRYLHHKGDIIVDNEGQPTISTSLYSSREVDLLFVDAKYLFASSDIFKAYRSEIVSTLVTWITKDISNIQKLLLEKTYLYYYPKTTLGTVKVYPDSVTEHTIDAEQSLVVNLYVNNSIYTNNDVRNDLVVNTIKVIEEFISGAIVNIAEIIIALNNQYNTNVLSLSVSNLGGSNNFTVITTSSDYNRLSLKKKLELQSDGSIIVVEDITVNFFRVEKLLTD